MNTINLSSEMVQDNLSFQVYRTTAPSREFHMCLRADGENDWERTAREIFRKHGVAITIIDGMGNYKVLKIERDVQYGQPYSLERLKAAMLESAHCFLMKSDPKLAANGIAKYIGATRIRQIENTDNPQRWLRGVDIVCGVNEAGDLVIKEFIADNTVLPVQSNKSTAKSVTSVNDIAMLMKSTQSALAE
jgi:hypothetical protein